MTQPSSSHVADRGALPAIFAVFLGLMITAVVGVGVYTFLPEPTAVAQTQIDTLYRQRDDVMGCGADTAKVCRSYDQLTVAEQARVDGLDRQIEVLRDRADAQRESWAQTTSIVLIVIATLLMTLSLVLAESMLVMSNGILLGGLFTMLYGVGWGLASGNAATRFVVLLVALGISLVLGYLRFVRPRRAPSGAAPSAQPSAQPSAPPSAPPSALVGATSASPGVAVAGSPDLAARVADLEARLAAVAGLLAPTWPGPGADAGRSGPTTPEDRDRAGTDDPGDVG